jgi:hypothetical protein
MEEIEEMEDGNDDKMDNRWKLNTGERREGSDNTKKL